MEMLTALVLICKATTLECGHDNAERVIRVPGDVPDQIQIAGAPYPISNVAACHQKGAAARQRVLGSLALDEFAMWVCVPKSIADSIGSR